MAAAGEFLREVGKDVGEDLALAALGAADAREPNPLVRLHGLDRGRAHKRDPEMAGVQDGNAMPPDRNCKDANAGRDKMCGGVMREAQGGMRGDGTAARGIRMREARAAIEDAGLFRVVVFFEDVKRVAVVKLHADGAEDGADGAGGAALLANHFAYILRRDAQAENRALVPAHRLDLDGGWLIHQGLGDLAHQFGD